MKYINHNYKGYSIQQRSDIKSHTAIIYRNGDIVKCISGDINSDGSNNAISKAMQYIDSLCS
jgi:hypothetical protein